jgi:hypothetical protein
MADESEECARCGYSMSERDRDTDGHMGKEVEEMPGFRKVRICLVCYMTFATAYQMGTPGKALATCVNLLLDRLEVDRPVNPTIKELRTALDDPWAYVSPCPWSLDDSHLWEAMGRPRGTRGRHPQEQGGEPPFQVLGTGTTEADAIRSALANLRTG